MIRRPPRSTLDRSSAASDVYKRQLLHLARVQGRRRVDAVPGRHPVPSRRTARQGRGAHRLQTANRIAALVVGLAAFAVLPVFLKSYGVYLCTLFCVTLMATYGLNLTVGYAGQMSLGQAAFYGIGAYIAATALKAGIPFFVILPLAAIVCFAVGLALGFPALRVQHHYLAFATLGFNVLVFLVMRNEEKLTGGTFGIANIPRPSILGLSFDSERAYFWFTLFFTVLLIALLWLSLIHISEPTRLLS